MSDLAAKLREVQVRKIHNLLQRYGTLPDPVTTKDLLLHLSAIVVDLNDRVAVLESHDTYENPEDE